MRYVWVGLTIVLLDLVGKLPATHGVSGDGLAVTLGWLQIRFFGGDAAVQLFQPPALHPGAGLVLLASLGAALFLLLRYRPLFMTYALLGLGVQFLAGGMLAEVLTRILYGEGSAILFHEPDGLVIVMLGVRHIALMTGVGVLVADQIVRYSARRVPPPVLQRAPEVAIDLSSLRRGDDNVHIEAALSPVFMRAAISAVTQLVNYYLAKHDDAANRDRLPAQFMQPVREAYAGMLRVAMNQERPSGATGRIDLLRLAVLMFVREQIRSILAEGIERRNERDRGTLHPRGHNGHDARKDAKGRLAAGRGTLFHRICRQIFLLLAAQEKNSLSGAGATPPAFNPAPLFSVPLLQAITREDDDVLMEYYTLLGHRSGDPYSFQRLDALFNEVFPSSRTMPSDNRSESVPGSEKVLAPSVLGVPENVTLLLDVAATREAVRTARSLGDKTLARQLRAQMRYQNMQLTSLRLALERAGLVTTLLALYETPKLYTHYSGEFSPHLINDLVRSRLSRRLIWRRLRLRAGRAADMPQLLPILQASHRVRRHRCRDISSNLLRFTEDFSTYRRDLQLYLATQEAVSKIRILYEEREIVTARLNRRLYEFPTPDEVAVSADAIAGHVILKADLRGSTLITEQLVRRELNPATYFSRNFYDPISVLTRLYHGEKIFIEGDAMILMFLETADPQRERLAVAGACALAARLLDVVARNNELNASYSLPPLELGIGISYQPGSPTYVFDGATRIVISPAINRADRLSSSVGGLRKHVAPRRYAPHAAVFEAKSNGDALFDKMPAELIYNVDGIVLEPAAFAQLAEELPLHRVLDVPDGLDDGEYFVTSWPSFAGKSQRLVIRRAQICALNSGASPVPESLQKHYFEVIAEPAILEELGQSRLDESGSMHTAVPESVPLS